MADLSTDKVPTIEGPITCQFPRPGGQPCKRRIADGETRCWQHASGLRLKIKSFARSWPIGFALSVLGVLGTLAFGALEVYWHYQNSPNASDSTKQKRIACEVETVNFGPIYRFFQEPQVYFERLDTSLRIGLTNHLGKPVYLRRYTAEALVETEWVQFRNADSASFEPYAFGVMAREDPGGTAPYIGRFDLSANGFDYVMQQRPLNVDEHIELWMFFISGLSHESAPGISRFRFVFDDGAGEKFACTCPYSIAADRGIVMGTNTGDLKAMPREQIPANMREEPPH